MTAKAESNAKYISGALVIHALIAGVLIAASLYSPRVIVPQLGIKAALVDSSSLNPPKKAEPEPDLAEQQKQEEQKKQEQLEEERQKEKQKEIEKQKEEQLRLEQQEKEKQAEQKRIADAQQEVKRQKQEADKKRVEEIKQKQRDVEAKRKQEADTKAQAAREAELKAQLAEEEGRNQAVNSGLQAQYVALIANSVYRHWYKPASARPGLNCQVSVRQARGGTVMSVKIDHCNGDAAVTQSIEAAVYASSPLPAPPDPRVFDSVLTFNFRPKD